MLITDKPNLDKITFEIGDSGYISDPYFSTEACVNRLLKEWDEHSRLIIACDFDDTLSGHHDIEVVREQMIELIKACKQMGCFIIIYTARGWDEYDEIKDFCNKYEIPYDTINGSNPEVKIKCAERSKLFYNIFFDDRCGLGQAYEIMVRTIKRKIELLREEE